MTNSLLPWDVLRRHAIGLDQLHAFAEAANSSNYPPHNIERIDDDRFQLTLAVAGFTKDQLEISLLDDNLLVSGTAPAGDSKNYVYRGLSMRSFKRVFKLAEHIHVTNASLDCGILSIDLERRLPVEQSPRAIAIT